MRSTETVKLPVGTALSQDPVLGLVLVDQERIVRLARGTPWELIRAQMRCSFAFAMPAAMHGRLHIVRPGSPRAGQE